MSTEFHVSEMRPQNFRQNINLAQQYLLHCDFITQFPKKVQKLEKEAKSAKAMSTLAWGQQQARARPAPRQMRARARCPGQSRAQRIWRARSSQAEPARVMRQAKGAREAPRSSCLRDQQPRRPRTEPRPRARAGPRRSARTPRKSARGARPRCARRPGNAPRVLRPGQAPAKVVRGARARGARGPHA